VELREFKKDEVNMQRMKQNLVGIFLVVGLLIGSGCSDNNTKKEIKLEVGDITLILEAIDESEKIATIRVIRNFTGIGLKEAVDLVENTPVSLLKNVAMNEATNLKRELGNVGATTSIQEPASAK